MNLAYLHGKPELSGSIRNQNEDFYVEEILGFEPDGAGEHLWLWVEKNGQNTGYIGKEIARVFGVPAKSVSHSGLKDRHAVTRQWFNLPWPIKQELPELELENAKILKAVRHGRKLKIGTHKANRFVIKVKLNETSTDIEQRLSAIKQFGVANYYGEQRFGRDGNNLDNAKKMLAGEIKVKDRKLKSIYLSAARSHLFNQILDARIHSDLFKPIDGDAFILAGSNSFFKPDMIDDEIIQRFESGDILLSGALVGKGEPLVSSQTQGLESSVLADYSDIVSGLVEAGLKQERRALQLPVEDFTWQTIEADGNCYLELDFKLPAGCFATSVLREIVDYQDMSK